MFEVNKSTRQIFRATLKDESGTPIPVASLDTLKLTLYDKSTDTIINARDAQDVKNANDVTVNAGGVVTWIVQPEDLPIVSSRVPYGARETHVALFEWTFDATGRGHRAYEFAVKNVEKVA